MHYQQSVIIALLVVVLCGLSLLPITTFANDSQQRRAVYYRYYDSKNVPTVSRSVSPTHIRRGYDALDRNMSLIYKVPPYNVEEDLKKEGTRAAQSIQQRKDLQLQRSYRNVAYATERKENALQTIQKQITQQYQRMNQLQTDRSKYLQQKSNYTLDRKPVPANLQTLLDNNEAHIKSTRNSIEQLKAVYAQQEQHFDFIISRLQKLQ